MRPKRKMSYGGLSFEGLNPELASESLNIKLSLEATRALYSKLAALLSYWERIDMRTARGKAIKLRLAVLKAKKRMTMRLF